MKYFTVIVLALTFMVSAIDGRARGQGTGPRESATSEKPRMLSDPGVFPIAVWLQDPRQAPRYKQAGINLYVGLWRGPTREQLDSLKAAEMPVICSQNTFGLANRDNPIIVGWMHGDEPDNAQEVVDRKTGKRSYGPPIPPARIVERYRSLKAADPTRPILLNLGQGVANDEWKGRGPAGRLEDYPVYVQGADIVSFDVYPVAGLERPGGSDLLWYVAKGVDRLVKWTGGRKRVWNCIECTHISNPTKKASPSQVRAEVWMSLVHGSRGLIYFVHQFKPRFNEHALLDDPEMLEAVTAINRQIQSLATVLNSPSLPSQGTVRSSATEVPIDLMIKRDEGTTYVFAVGMRNAPTRGSFMIEGLPEITEADVLGEERSISVKGGRFEDDFQAYGVHLYAIRPPGKQARPARP